MRRHLSLTILALLVAAPIAQAGPRFSLGPGTVPHIVVEPTSGTAHVVWQQGDTTMECNVPRGTTSCTPQVVNMGLPPDRANADRPWLLRAADGTLYILMARYVWNDAYLARSTDGGATWSTGIPVYKAAGAGIVGTDQTEPVLFPDGEVTVASFNGGGNVFAARLDGAEAGGGPVAALPSIGPGHLDYDIQVVPTSDGGMLGAAHDGPGWIWRMTPGADPSQSSSWGPPAQFTAATDETRVASGPSGAYVLSVEPGGDFRHVVIRRLGTAGFGPPVEAESQTGYITDLTEAPSGTVAGAWRTNGNDPSNRLRFSTSRDGSSFTTVTIARGSEVFSDLDVSIARDDRGFAVWEDGNGAIAMASTDPIADPGAPPGTGTTVITYAHGTITLGMLKPGCVRAGAAARVQLRATGLKPLRVDFNVGAKRIKKVTHAPFRASVRVRRGPFAEVRARVFVKVRHGRSPVELVRVRIPICA